MAPPINLVISIDTEEDNWRPAREGVTVQNILELPRLQRLLESLGVRPTYFTTYQVARDPRSAAVMREIHDGGHAEIGAHLHPWNTPPLDEEFVPRNTMPSNLSRELQLAKIRALTEQVTKCLGRRPDSFRAGRWGFATKTAGALLECGYRVDSSVTPFKSWTKYDDGPRHFGAPLSVYRLDGRADTRIPVSDGRLIEVPLSWGYDLRRRYWGISRKQAEPSSGLRTQLLGILSRLRLVRQIALSPETDSVADMLLLSQRLMELGLRHLHLSWHSPTLTPGLTPFTRTAADVEAVYASIANYVEGLARIATIVPATVSEAADRLAPPLTADLPEPVSVPLAAPNGGRLVVVSYHFPPDPAIGGQRWAGLTKYLRAWRWRSWVVTAAPHAGVATGGVVVTSERRLSTLNDFYRSLRNRSTGAQSNPTAAATRPRTESWFARMRTNAGFLLAFPDEGRGWVLRAAWRTRRLLARLRPTVLVSSGPPHSAHLAAWLARLGRPVRWIVDLRDPWAGPITGAWARHPVSRSAFARWVLARLERLVIGSADAVICNTAQLTAALRARYPTAAIEWIANGADGEQLPRRSVQRFPGLAITHVGTIYGGRSLGTLLRAMRTFLDQEPRARNDGTKLRIAGHVEPVHAAELQRDVESLALQHHVELLGVLPRAGALDLVSRSGLALVLAQQQEFQVPAKLYELIVLGVPTVVVAGAESAAGTEAARLGAWRVDDGDVQRLADLLQQAWGGALEARADAAASADYREIAGHVDRILRNQRRAPSAEQRPVPNQLQLSVTTASGE
jgi:glycosyltransferase involved in cell wall biosynthesis